MSNQPQTPENDFRLPQESLNRFRRATSLSENQSNNKTNVQNDELNVDDINLETHFKNEKKSHEWTDSMLQDPRISRFTHQKLSLIEKSLLGITSISIFLNIARLQIETYKENEIVPTRIKEQASRNLLLVLSLCTIIISNFVNYQVVLVIVRKLNLYQLQLHQKRKFLFKSSVINYSMFYNFITKSGEASQLLLEIILCAFHPNIFCMQIRANTLPKVQNPDPTHPVIQKMIFFQEPQNLLQVLFLIKIYLVIRSAISLTIYAEPRAARICNYYKIKHSVFFQMKCLFHDYPITSFFVTYFFMIFCFGLCLRSAEIPRYIIDPPTSESLKQNFIKFTNCFWCAFITMTTIGYNDYASQTHLGRYISIIFAIIGVIMNSLLLIIVVNYLRMLSSETKAYLTEKILSEKQKIKKQAAMTLSGIIKMSHFMDQGAKKSSITKHFQELKRKIDQTKVKLKEIKSMRSNEEYMVEDVSSSFCRVQRQCQQMYKNQVKILRIIKGVEQSHNFKQKFKIQYFKEVQSQEIFQVEKQKTSSESEKDNIQWIN